MYVVNMFYYHFLIKRLIWSRVRENIAMQILSEIQREGRQSPGDVMKPPEEWDVRALVVNHSHVAIHRLIEMG